MWVINIFSLNHDKELMFKLESTSRGSFFIINICSWQAFNKMNLWGGGATKNQARAFAQKFLDLPPPAGKNAAIDDNVLFLSILKTTHTHAP